MLLKRPLVLTALVLASTFFAPVALAGHQAYAVTILEQSKAPLNRQVMGMIAKKDYTALEKLVKTDININEADTKGVRPVHYAAYLGDTEAMDILIKGGVNLTGKTFGGWTALHYAAHTGHVEMSKFLVSHGVPIEVKDTGGETALFYAVEGGWVPVVQWFIDNGADVNNGNNKGETPLDVAKENKHPKLIEILEKAGAKAGTE